MTEKNQSMEYNPLEKLEQSLYNEPLNEENSAFGYYADNIPEGSWDVFNAHSNQIMNKTVSTLYRIADSTFGWAMPHEAREELQFDLEQMREDYIDTENNINKYLYDYANGTELVALSVGGMLYRGFADPINQAINLSFGPYGFFINLLADGTQYMADTSFYENRNPLAEPKLQDLANVGMNAVISYGAMKSQQKYTCVGNDFLYNEIGKFDGRKPSWEQPTQIEKKYLIDVNNPDEFMPKKSTEIAPIDKLFNANQNTGLLNVMQQRGYEKIINTKDAAEVAMRQIYGQPQGNYTKQGTEEGIKNFIGSVTRLNKTYQEELAKSRKNLQLKTGKKQQQNKYFRFRYRYGAWDKDS